MRKTRRAGRSSEFSHAVPPHGYLQNSTLDNDTAAEIKGKVTGKIYILGCDQAVAARAGGMQALATRVGHPVIGNTGCVFAGVWGRGDWVQFG